MSHGTVAYFRCKEIFVGCSFAEPEFDFHAHLNPVSLNFINIFLIIV